MGTKADLVSDTELVPADFLPDVLADSMTDAKQESAPLVHVAAVPKAPVPANTNAGNVPDLDTAAPLEGAPAATQPAPVSLVFNDNSEVNSNPAVPITVELLPLQDMQEDNCSGSNASAPADADSSVVEQVGKPDAAASLDLDVRKRDTDAVADMSAQLVPPSAAEDSALPWQQTFHTALMATDAAETTEATGGDEPATTLQGNTEGTGGVVPITTPAVEVQQAAQQLLLAHPASAGRPDHYDTPPDMPSYNGSKRQDARLLSAQPVQLSGPAVPATISAADSLVDTALKANTSAAQPHGKEIAERPIAGDLSSPDLEAIKGPEDLIPGRVTDPKSFPAQADDLMASMLLSSAATPSLEGSALVPGSADAGTREPTESEEDSLHAMPAR